MKCNIQLKNMEHHAYVVALAIARSSSVARFGFSQNMRAAVLQHDASSMYPGRSPMTLNPQRS